MRSFKALLAFDKPHDTCVHVCLRVQVSVSHNMIGSVSVFTKYLRIWPRHIENVTAEMPFWLHERTCSWMSARAHDQLIRQPVRRQCHLSLLTAKSLHLFCDFEWNYKLFLFENVEVWVMKSKCVKTGSEELLSAWEALFHPGAHDTPEDRGCPGRLPIGAWTSSVAVLMLFWRVCEPLQKQMIKTGHTFPWRQSPSTLSSSPRLHTWYDRRFQRPERSFVCLQSQTLFW